MDGDVTARFFDLVARPEPDVAARLDEAALLVAAHVRPALDVTGYMDRLDDLAATCPTASLDGLVHHLFVAGGFTGNSANFGDVDNSCLDQVIDRRLGIPITLAVVMMTVGRRLGVELAGIGMPGHFLVRSEADTTVLIDPFSSGVRLSRSDCIARFRATQGDVAFEAWMLDPVGSRAIVTRMLTNLGEVYRSRSDSASLEWVLRFRAGIPGASVRMRAEHGGALASQGRFVEAAALFEELAGLTEGERSQRLHARAVALRARLN